LTLLSQNADLQAEICSLADDWISYQLQYRYLQKQTEGEFKAIWHKSDVDTSLDARIDDQLLVELELEETNSLLEKAMDKLKEQMTIARSLNSDSHPVSASEDAIMLGPEA
jgi:acyl-ACP thioesterase